ncbi:hypothetical protein OPAG_00113 [Rhodococcus opacus PD630]|uniref:DoxX family protein n=1 Tax=Rhodococcus TaxID=1827 RepID=UPI00029CB0CA|nr:MULTISPECIES: DoxX family protein [Rhodococcus]RZK84961.1 MAG: DoxX family protein [Rhodococcus sp. (in: high G+C Gram-positive bacteria)]AHK32905.1 hypothetical protein Pd630_LPD05714 [Rhodococcus opacus PD630]EHI41137.1 hypothetical protein OPAG_00113 [Rhodococcus opacus PD630]KXX58513.1 hypothetical protein AZG88_45280 [Rhodococcus sp. LB1]PBC49443.1 DoxX family protein [Rhodococcus sp. ACPA1]
MEVFLIVCGVLLAVSAVAVSIPKLRLKGTAWTGLQSRGLSRQQVRLIGVAELAGGVGVLVGLYWTPLGVISTVALLILLLCAIAFHVRHGDYGNPDTRAVAMPAVYLAMLAVLASIGFVFAG